MKVKIEFEVRVTSIELDMVKQTMEQFWKHMVVIRLTDGTYLNLYNSAFSNAHIYLDWSDISTII